MKLLVLLTGLICVTTINAQPKSGYNLNFSQLPHRWDEALPLGNGWLGALIWQKENKLRISLDRVDLWDDRPMPQIGRLTFKWVAQQVLKGEYDTVQKIGDWPYDQNAAPCKIPGAAIEFSMSDASVVSASLDISNGISSVVFSNGIRFASYVHANKLEGYFGWTEFDPSMIDSFLPSLIPPRYQDEQKSSQKDWGSLTRLGYKQGTVTKGKNSLRYHQPTWGAHYYEVLIEWVNIYNKKLVGAWTISVDKPASLGKIDTANTEYTDMRSHLEWWKDYWDRSSVSIPDNLLAKQYYLDMYKFGCVARPNTPPISLQAIWTADDGRLPPWKGDLHHDLNTQLSYWPGYTSNHTDLTAGFTNWLWKLRPENKRWTKQYFGVDGLNMPGVSTISGKPMGGWIQYAMSPTTACWLAQNFYWQWRFTNDTVFLRQRAYPWIRDVATYIVNLVRKKDRNYYLPLSSSPEYNDNNITAWFSDWTNYDLSLVSYLLQTESIMASTLNIPQDAQRKRLEEVRVLLPSAAVNETGLLMAPGVNMEHSHRHMSPYISIFPLKNLQVVAKAEKNDTQVIRNSFRHLESLGTRKWVGYSFAWIANMYAANGNGDSAVKHLRIFASNFVSPNSFHLNGDQRGGEYSDDKGRPFTLEGNFAFAQGIHEMLLQNENAITVFPALPADWNSVSFHNLRTEGGYLVSAVKENGVVISVSVTATTDGKVRIKKPRHFHTWIVEGVPSEQAELFSDIFSVRLKKGQTILIKNGFE